MSKANGLPLHQRAHWRRTREVVTEIAKFERFNINDFDMLHMRAYETVGDDLKGYNVSYNIKDNLSCWVFDNRYDMFEVPARSNEPGSPYGTFLFFAHNTSFDYYVFGEMTVTLDKGETVRNGFVTEKVRFEPYGKYVITFEGSKNNITKLEYGYKFDPGVSSREHNFPFDSYNGRKHAYGLDQHKILKKLGVKSAASDKIVGKSKVEVYKNKNKKSQPKNSSNKSNTKKLGRGSKPRF